MANVQYLFWVMVGTLTVLSIFIGVVVGRTKTPRAGFITFAALWLLIIAAIVLITHAH
ncbi:hypothetical protein N4G40_07950 [Pantoea eucrina]|uniref:DUF1328 domain-containing protein n=1 Tax=Pantoea eucrina TaxID=472693 RepID=A0ABU5LE38_9GAMM|nr:hypothetical protein [Pantoea eucrina]MDZ7278205.1 hypothetical protein [Pantoea eucrina]